MRPAAVVDDEEPALVWNGHRKKIHFVQPYTENYIKMLELLSESLLILAEPFESFRCETYEKMS